ncbi:N-6 DNA methylase [Luteipulveratus halotolerans]|uniref:DNA methylase adenine-specific domain-containing protein n=1 Tax=Luteipulveratus halotolerans TaxID=1631356 RepID=A0A0L6CEU5_9MICO|nr:N-6 DNA methylase [Luteipulveratus halotolerans]KNX36090.1 hypothetical protein VV01_01270 [Luteipulveratus halotolerans]
MDVRQDVRMPAEDTAVMRKARGAFFTPPPVARFITAWAVRDTADDVIEPSCGEAVFLHQLGKDRTGRTVGVEIHPASATRSQDTLRSEGIAADIHVRDFFLHDEFGEYDVAVGNPPYVREPELDLDLDLIEQQLDALPPVALRHDVVPDEVSPARFFAVMLAKVLDNSPVDYHVTARDLRARAGSSAPGTS